MQDACACPVPPDIDRVVAVRRLAVSVWVVAARRLVAKKAFLFSNTQSHNFTSNQQLHPNQRLGIEKPEVALSNFINCQT
jgi:hypothetical protein